MSITKILYRPVGEKEYVLIAESKFKAFPPRLEWQPIFYPVLNYEYACEIAYEWNTDDSFGNYLGIVTEFDILQTEFDKYKIENVGGSHHNELWVPSEALTAWNKAIVGEIKAVKIFIGKQFVSSEYDVINELILDI